ncbi:hypothetical protein DFH01_27545 [Falsiroseomonas bella]|uniref:SRPBCC family protein n=1 Tax=Falsiroseomonas bella TaxID=2184016 RepID=A0A317F6B6_9PROT|nr:SRPBCC family protein [Falsiroseomonas bella]PWS34082.1 hypothetical protein DFH01_27545 [Falsiroseomonas bella]
MADHHARIIIAAPAAEVFAFIANPMNLPRWQPSLREAFREDEARIRVIGGGVGAQGVAAHARFLVEHEARRLCWAAEAGIGCAGDVTVTETPDGAEVALELRLGPRAERPEAVRRWTGDAALDIAAAMQASLEAVRRHCEGAVQGVTLVSGGTQSDPSTAPLRDSRAYGTSVEPDRG